MTLEASIPPTNSENRKPLILGNSVGRVQTPHHIPPAPIPINENEIKHNQSIEKLNMIAPGKENKTVKFKVYHAPEPFSTCLN